MLCYAITSRALYPGNEQEKQAKLLKQTDSWITEGINFIQLREKDLAASDLALLASKVLKKIGLSSSATKLLINSRPDIALATGAHGVHLTAASDELSPALVRAIYASRSQPSPLITISCHTITEVQHACQNHVDAILFSPIFEKSLADEVALPGQGLDQLRVACIAASHTPVYALGGITLRNAPSCHAAGAAGIAGIRLFQSL